MKKRKHKKVMQIVALFLTVVIGMTGIPFTSMTTYAAQNPTTVELMSESEMVEENSVSESSLELDPVKKDVPLNQQTEGNEVDYNDEAFRF